MQAEGGGSAPSSDLGCAEVENSLWCPPRALLLRLTANRRGCHAWVVAEAPPAARRRRRKLCFGELHSAGEGPEGLARVVVNLTITKRDKGTVPGIAADPDWLPSCGDSLRMRFTSHRSIFAPYQEEAACGVHALSFIVPPDAPSYRRARRAGCTAGAGSQPRAHCKPCKPRCQRAAGRRAAPRPLPLV